FDTTAQGGLEEPGKAGVDLASPAHHSIDVDGKRGNLLQELCAEENQNHFLGPPDGKGRDEDLATLGDGACHGFDKALFLDRALWVQAVSVRGLEDRDVGPKARRVHARNRPLVVHGNVSAQEEPPLASRYPQGTGAQNVARGKKRDLGAARV